MTVLHTGAVEQARCQVVLDATDTGTTNAAAAVVFLAAGDVEVARCVMSFPAWQSPSASGTMLANAIADDTNAAGGTVTAFEIHDLDDNRILRGSVTTIGGGGDIEMSSVNIGSGDTVSITAMQYFSAQNVVP